MKKVSILALLCAAVFTLGMASCEEKPATPNEENNEQQPEEKPEPKPEQKPIPLPDIPKDVPACSISEFTNWQTHFADDDVIGDFSGLCFNKDRTGLIGVSNYQGRLYNINFDGTRDEKEFLRTGKDLEGVTIDPETGIIYVCEEGGNYIWKVEEYDGEYVATRVKFIKTSGDSNSGLEAITYHDGYLYVANQSPATLYIYSLEHGEVAHRYSARVIRKCFSDLWFDTTNNTLWAVDAWGNEIVNFTVWGDYIARFKVPEVPWVEGICIDFENNKAWFSCDSTGQLFSADIVRNN